MKMAELCLLEVYPSQMVLMRGDNKSFNKEMSIHVSQTCICGHLNAGITCLKQPLSLGTLSKNTLQMNLY